MLFIGISPPSCPTYCYSDMLLHFFNRHLLSACCVQGTGVGPGDMAALKTACSVSPTGLTLIGQMVTSYSVLFHVAISAMKDECGVESMPRDHTRGQWYLVWGIPRQLKW